MSALSAAASDEDGDTISNLKGQLGRANALCRIRLDRIRELEAMLRGASKVEQEPIGEAHLLNASSEAFTHCVWDSRVVPVGTKLYTHPQQPRQPLTDEQIYIIKLAFEAGWGNVVSMPHIQALERSAAGVAAAEREFCAQVCDEASKPRENYAQTDEQWAASTLAERIRARGNA